jgi:translin
LFFTKSEQGENLETLKIILKEVKKELMQKDEVRENAQQSMRKATSLSKQAILFIHQKRHKEAKKLIENSKEIIFRLQALAKENPDIIYSGMFSAALQEYAEANIFLELIRNSRFVTPNELNVPSADYVLGLADVVGEYRRLTLDALREGDAEKGKECLKTMDEIYVELMAMDEAYMLVPGLRRKCDVARRVIESTRGDVTQEVRRKALENYLKQFERAQERKRQARKG